MRVKISELRAGARLATGARVVQQALSGAMSTDLDVAQAINRGHSMPQTAADAHCAKRANHRRRIDEVDT